MTYVARMVRLAMALGFLGAACESGGMPLDPPTGISGGAGAAASAGDATGAASGSSGAGMGGTGGGGVGAADAAVSSAADGSSYSSDQCRWEGYGIGPLGAGQCNTQHLMAHSWMECSVSGGMATMQRDLVDQCTAEQADEV
jgi:hypothetical protein